MPKTSKERFDEVMKQVDANKANSGEVSDSDVDEVEKYMEQNPQEVGLNGNQKPNHSNLHNLQETTLGNIQKLNPAKRKAHLSPDEVKLVTEAYKKFETKRLNHPVLEHLFQTKVKLSSEYSASQQKAKRLYQEMLKQMSESSEQNLKIIGALENVDKQIIEILKTEEGSDLPPSA